MNCIKRVVPLEAKANLRDPCHSQQARCQDGDSDKSQVGWSHKKDVMAGVLLNFARLVVSRCGIKRGRESGRRTELYTTTTTQYAVVNTWVLKYNESVVW